MAAALTLDQVNDLARYAFGPTARAIHHPRWERGLRCEVEVPILSAHPRSPGAVVGVSVHSGATWASAFSKAGWELPPPPQTTYVQIGAAVYKVFGEARERLAVASSNEVATLIAKGLNALR